MKKPIFKISEHQLQTEIMNYLRYKGWYVERLNAGKYSVGEGRSRRFINGVAAGTPDLMAFTDKRGSCDSAETGGDYVNHVELVFIEVKIPGNKPTSLQTAKMKELSEYGARCLVIHSIDELEKRL